MGLFGEIKLPWNEYCFARPTIGSSRKAPVICCHVSISPDCFATFSREYVLQWQFVQVRCKCLSRIRNCVAHSTSFFFKSSLSSWTRKNKKISNTVYNKTNILEDADCKTWSRARRVGQDLHHLIAGFRCSVCRSSPRVRRSRGASFFWRSADCNGRTVRRPRNCAISQQVSAGSRSGRRIAIPRPSRRRETVERLNDGPRSNRRWCRQWTPVRQVQHTPRDNTQNDHTRLERMQGWFLRRVRPFAHQDIKTFFRTNVAYREYGLSH